MKNDMTSGSIDLYLSKVIGRSVMFCSLSSCMIDSICVFEDPIVGNVYCIFYIHDEGDVLVHYC